MFWVSVARSSRFKGLKEVWFWTPCLENPVKALPRGGMFNPRGNKFDKNVA